MGVTPSKCFSKSPRPLKLGFLFGVMAGKIHRKKKSSDFVTIDTHCSRNKNLRWGAKGLHTYLMQLPEDWQINISDLVNRSLDGRDATSAAVKALIAEGYVVRELVHNGKGLFEGYDYHLFERPEHAVEWLSVNGKTVNGKTVNGKTATSKVLSNSKNEESEDELNLERFAPPAPAESETVKAEEVKRGLVAPPAEAAAPTHTVTTIDPAEPGLKVVSPFTMPKRVDTVDEAEAIIMEWAKAEGRESVRKWYAGAARQCTAADVAAMVAKFAGVYLTVSDEGKRQRMAQDPLQFFKYTFKQFLQNEKSFGAKVMPGASAAQQTPPANFQTSTRY
jgi:hypothetical protein